MSHSVYAHVVELDKLAAVIGSKDKKAVDRIAKGSISGQSVSRHWREIDELVDDGEMTCRDALEDLVFARKTRRKYTYLYVYALETLCKLYGRRAGERYVRQTWFQEGTSAKWLMELDGALSKAGAINIVFDLYGPLKKSKSLPLPISITTDDWPYVALVPYERCEEARASILAGIGKVKPPLREAALELYTWLGEVGPGDVLALFNY